MSSQSVVLGQQDSGPKPNPLGVFNIFIDPVATARSVPAPLAWLAPLLIFCVTLVIFSWLTIPMRMHVMVLNPPGGQAMDETMRGRIETFSKVGAFIAPVFVVGLIALMALLVMLLCSAMSMKASFRNVFTIMCATSLIGTLQLIASYIVLRSKGDDLQSMQQLQPSFGLDIFFSDLKGPLFAILNYFSIFQVWSLVMLALTLAYLTKSSKGKAFAAITPAWVIPLLFAIVGSLFQR